MGTIGIDIKNISLFRGGIAHFCKPLIRAWIKHAADKRFVLIGPAFDDTFIRDLENWTWKKVPFFHKAPILLRHPLYDFVLSYRAVRTVAPDLYFSPYFDGFLPGNIPSVITIHDTCFSDAANLYPRHLRRYYLFLLRHNAASALRVLTVSRTSKRKIQQRYGVPADKISVVYNSVDRQFSDTSRNHQHMQALKNRYQLEGVTTILYPGGLELRKNIENLVRAVAILGKDSPAPVKLLISGKTDARAIGRWPCLTERHADFGIVFTGYLETDMLKQLYYLSDVVVYPSFCEGFGRVCLDAMATGTPLVCSDLEVMHEIGGDFPYFCNPSDPKDIARQMTTALTGLQDKRPQVDRAFSQHETIAAFLRIMNSCSNCQS